MGNIIFRVGDDQKKIYEAAAFKAGVSLSNWLKSLADDASGYVSGAKIVLRGGKKESTPVETVIKTVEDVKAAVDLVKKKSEPKGVVPGECYTGASIFKLGHTLYEVIEDGVSKWTQTPPGGDE